MRALLVIVGIAALALLAAMQFNIVDLRQTKPAVVQAPTFQADVAKVSIGTENKTVAVPTIEVQKPGESPKQ